MHAISPQVMVWDPTSPVGIPTAQLPDVQAMQHAMAPQQLYRVQEAMPPIYASAAYPAARDQQGGVVWVQHPPLVTQEEADMSHAFVHNQVPMQQHSLVPVLMTVNGQRMVMHQAVPQIPPPQPRFCQVSPDVAQNEGIHLVNINQRIQQGVRLTPVPQDQRQRGVLMPSFQEKHATLFDRPRLTPRRRHGTCFSAPGAIANWRPSGDERSLGGSNTAIRRRSQSADHDGISDDAQNNTSESPSPNKRSAPTSTDLEKHDEFWRAPDVRNLRKLIDIIEYYFSDECISKNGYMLKQLSNGETEGSISLRRVAALKRVKAQTRDLRTVAYAVRQSAKLEMDEEGTAIRRKRPLPDNIEAPRFIRSVFAINLPKELPSVEDVTSLFAPYGELTQVRVVRPGKSIPSYLKDYIAWVPDLGTRVCAVVEFENQDEAQKACRDINMQNRGQNSLRVALLKPGARIRRTLYRKYKEEFVEGAGDIADNSGEKEDVKSEKPEVATSANARPRCLSDSSYESTGNDVTCSAAATEDATDNNLNKSATNLHYDASASNSDTDSDRSKSEKRRIPSKAKSESDTHNTFISSGDSGYSRSSSSDERDSLVYSNSTPTRSKSESGLEAPGPKRTPPIQKKFIDGVPVGVERQPKGPVGDSKGFNESRSAAN